MIETGRGFRISNQFEQLPNCQIREFPTGELLAGKPVWVSYTADEKPGCDNIKRIPLGDWVWKRYQNGRWEEVFRFKRTASSTKNSWSWLDAAAEGEYFVELENTGFAPTFSVRALTINIEQEKQERVEADKSLGDRISSLDRWARDQVAGILASIEDVISRAEQEATAWRKALDDFKAGLFDWLIDRVLGIVLTALDTTAETHINQTINPFPEGYRWGEYEAGTAENVTRFPVDPAAIQDISQEIAEGRHKAWKTKRKMM